MGPFEHGPSNFILGAGRRQLYDRWEKKAPSESLSHDLYDNIISQSLSHFDFHHSPPCSGALSTISGAGCEAMCINAQVNEGTALHNLFSSSLITGPRSKRISSICFLHRARHQSFANVTALGLEGNSVSAAKWVRGFVRKECMR